MKRGSRLNRFLDFYFGIPILAATSALRRKREWPTTIDRIGILLNPALGDTLLSSGALRDIRLAFPEARLILFASASNIAAAKMISGIDQIGLISVTNPLGSIRTMRAASLDLLVDFTSWQRITAIMSTSSNARFVVGYHTPKQYRHFGYDRTVEHRRDRHEIENHRVLAENIGATTKCSPQLVLPPSRPLHLPPGAREIIVFHAWPSGTRSWLREWPEERWVELAGALRQPGRMFFITGSPDDVPRSQALCSLLLQHGVPAQIFAGTDGLASVGRLLLEAALLVSVNTGIMHLGAILGTPTVGINGPNAQGRWGPVGPCVAGVDTADGSGGFLHLGFEFDGNPMDTMRRISTAQVLDAAQSLLAVAATA